MPRHYLPQLQISLFVLGLQEADYFEWAHGQTNLVRVKRDQAYIDAMLERLTQFHETWMGMKGKKPPRKTKRKVDHDFI